MSLLCHSAFVRVATLTRIDATIAALLCHSAFVRVATIYITSAGDYTRALPQRIRAGCDCSRPCNSETRILCHSAFVRVATPVKPFPPPANSFATAHSCGLRRDNDTGKCKHDTFATAHSCGLRHPHFYPHVDKLPFATAHSCGLRRFDSFQKMFIALSLPQRIRAGCDDSQGCACSGIASLPQRIRAGCDRQETLTAYIGKLCHSAFVRVATRHLQAPPRHSVFATAHSCGLRP